MIFNFYQNQIIILILIFFQLITEKNTLKTLEITDRTYHDYFTYFSPVDYITNEKLPNADKFFKMFQPKEENREYVRKVLDYTITGDTKARKFFIWYGF